MGDDKRMLKFKSDRIPYCVAIPAKNRRSLAVGRRVFCGIRADFLAIPARYMGWNESENKKKA